MARPTAPTEPVAPCSFLAGEAVYLRPLELDDLPQFRRWFADREVTRYSLSKLLFPHSELDLREWLEWTIRDMLRTSLLAVVECNRTCVETDQRFEFSTISVPALIIQGDCDASIPIELSGRVAAQLIRGSRLSTYENGPHGLYLTHRDRLIQDLHAFMEA